MHCQTRRYHSMGAPIVTRSLSHKGSPPRKFVPRMGNGAPPRAKPGTNKSKDMMPLRICYYQVLKALVKNQIPDEPQRKRLRRNGDRPCYTPPNCLLMSDVKDDHQVKASSRCQTSGQSKYLDIGTTSPPIVHHLVLSTVLTTP